MDVILDFSSYKWNLVSSAYKLLIKILTFHLERGVVTESTPTNSFKKLVTGNSSPLNAVTLKEIPYFLMICRHLIN